MLCPMLQTTVLTSTEGQKTYDNSKPTRIKIVNLPNGTERETDDRKIN